MAWTGAGVNAAMGSTLVRISGLSLAAGATGTIGMNGDAGADHTLPAGFALSATLTFSHVQPLAAGAYLNPLIVTPATGAPLRITVTNQDGANATGNLDILVRNMVH